MPIFERSPIQPYHLPARNVNFTFHSRTCPRTFSLFFVSVSFLKNARDTIYVYNIQVRARGSCASSWHRVAELLPAGVCPGPVGRLQEERLRPGARKVGPRRVSGREADHLLRWELQLRVVRQVEIQRTPVGCSRKAFVSRARVGEKGGASGVVVVGESNHLFARGVCRAIRVAVYDMMCSLMYQEHELQC